VSVDEEDDCGEPIRAHPAFGWGRLAVVLAALMFARCL